MIDHGDGIRITLGNVLLLLYARPYKSPGFGPIENLRTFITDKIYKLLPELKKMRMRDYARRMLL